MSYPQWTRSQSYACRGTSSHAERMARADGCPTACGNYQPPDSVEDDGPGGFRAHYICGHCGHRWYTSWEDN